MFSELRQYIYQNHRLDLPGIGTISLDRKPADLDFTAKLVHPPVYSISFDTVGQPVSHSLYKWLSMQFAISERDAVIRFNEFIFDLKQKLQSGSQLRWPGIGILSKSSEGTFLLDPALAEKSFGPPLPAVKVLREKAEHKVRVGEDEKTSVEMIELLQPADGRKSYFNLISWIVLAILIIFLAWFFAVNGFTLSNVGNIQKLDLSPIPGSHKIIS